MLQCLIPKEQDVSCMPVQQIGGIFVPVSNLERSIEFYTQMLGFVSRGIEDWGDGRRGATLFCDPHPENAALLTLAETQDPISTYKPNFNIKCADVTSMHAILEAHGCKVTELETWDSPWNHHVMFDVVDPDGHMVNLIEMIPIEAVKSGQ
jgi:lactoylglutathione lyase